MPTTTPLPYELWEEVAYCIPSARDLLSLALASRFFSSFIIPYHLPYRHVRYDTRRKDIWEHLAANPRCTRGIRSLTLIDKHDGIFLSDIVNNLPVEDSIMLPLLTSLSHMTALEKVELRWRHGHQDLPIVNDICRVLVDRATCLRSLIVMFKFSPIGQAEMMDHLNFHPLWQLSNLTQVALSHLCEPAEKMLVDGCPNLEDLVIYLDNPNSHSSSLILQYGSWTRLRSLSFTGKVNFAPEDMSSEDQQSITAGFFQRHPNLEYLLVDSTLYPPAIPESVLPKLRSVTWRTDSGSQVFSFLSNTALSRLVHCEIDGPLRCPARMDSLETLCIGLYCTSAPDILRKAPNLRKLSIEDEPPPGRVPSYCTNCTKLTHVDVSITTSQAPKLEDICREWSRVKALQYIRVWLIDTPVFAKIERDSDDNYIGHHVITESEFGEAPDEWGGYFCVVL